MRLLMLTLCCVSLTAHAQWRRIRQPCASNGMSCSPGPCCRGTKCDGNVCRAPQKDWSEGRNPNEPGPDDKPKKKVVKKDK
ncbi:MAG: hypothetical protein JNM17_25045 [Archangium sp.]|nr:hypothetical protein [Archangium sp.]